MSILKDMDLSKEVLQPDFNLNRYLGEWYEIAKTPNFFEIGCASAKARYDKLSNTVISVINTCLDEDGDCKSRTCEEAGRNNCRHKCECIPGWIWGQAKVLNPLFPAALRVSFFGEPDILPSGIPNYLIHSTNYKGYALVGDPGRVFLFILARKPVMKKSEFKKLVKFAKSLGYDTDKIIINTRKGKPVVY